MMADCVRAICHGTWNASQQKRFHPSHDAGKTFFTIFCHAVVNVLYRETHVAHVVIGTCWSDMYCSVQHMLDVSAKDVPTVVVGTRVHTNKFKTKEICLLEVRGMCLVSSRPTFQAIHHRRAWNHIVFKSLRLLLRLEADCMQHWFPEKCTNKIRFNFVRQRKKLYFRIFYVAVGTILYHATYIGHVGQKCTDVGKICWTRSSVAYSSVQHAVCWTCGCVSNVYVEARHTLFVHSMSSIVLNNNRSKIVNYNISSEHEVYPFQFTQSPA